MIDQVFILKGVISSNWRFFFPSNKLTDIYGHYQGEKDDKIIAVCADDPEYMHFNDIKELPPRRLAEIRRFFEDCIPQELDYIIIYSNIKAVKWAGQEGW